MSTNQFDGATHISVVLDRSGSMEHLTDDTIGGFNSWLRSVKTAAKSNPDTFLTLHLFDDQHEYPYLDAPLGKVKALTGEVYFARGATALRDAFGAEILRLGHLVGRNDRALILVITDGYENASREVTHAQLKRAIQKYEKRPNWTFQYIGANQDAFAVGRDMGMSANMVTARADAAGVASTYRAISTNTADFVAADMVMAAPLTQADYDDALAS
jgi:hypothetical protein